MKAPHFSRFFTVLAVGLAAFLTFLLSHYFSPERSPRFRIESFFFWFVAAGIAAVALRRSSSGGEDGDRDEVMDVTHLKWVFGFLLAVSFVQYWRGLGVGFLSDDFVLAEWAAKREWIHASATGFVRPIVPFIWFIVSALPGSLPHTVHIINVVLHALNATLVVALATQLGARRLEAAAAGLIFVTFPALSEAVVWASGMQDVLMTTFVLGSILAVLDAEFSAGASFAAIGGMLVAILTKETAVATPVLASLVVWVSPLGIGRGRRLLTLAGMMAVAVVYGIVRVVMGTPAGYGSGVSRYFAKQLIVDPFASLGAPWTTGWIDFHPSSSLFRALLIVGLLTIAFATWRRDIGFKRACVFAAWVLAGVLPVFSLFYVSGALEGSRYLYLPAAGFSLLLAALARTAANRAPERLYVASLATAAAALVLPAMTSTPFEIARWTAAAEMRDQVLVSYVRIMQDTTCGSFVAEGKVDSVDGAFVLRNGFTQALLEMGAEVPSPSADPPCKIDWSDHLVVKQ